MPSLPRDRCRACGRDWSIRRLVQRDDPRGPICHKCYFQLTAANDRSVPAAKREPKPQNHARRLRSKNLTAEQFDALLAEQDGRCAICLGAPLGAMSLVVDHNHDTGAVRGLLCGACNTALGMFLDDPDLLERARSYLVERGNYAHGRGRLGSVHAMGARR